MNVQMHTVTLTGRDGRVSQLENVYVRGSKVRFFVVPDMVKDDLFLLLLLSNQNFFFFQLRNAPMFKRIGPGSTKGRGIGIVRGKATVARAQGFSSFFFFFFSSRRHLC